MVAGYDLCMIYWFTVVVIDFVVGGGGSVGFLVFSLYSVVEMTVACIRKLLITDSCM